MKGIDADINAGEIWLLIDSRQFGGIESHVIELAKGLDRYNQRVRIILIHQYQQRNELVERLLNTNLRFSCLDALFPGQHSFLALLKLVKQHPPTILHAHGYKAAILAKLTTLFIRTPIAVTYHAGEKPKGKVWLYDFIDRYTAFISALSFSVSPMIDKKIPCKTVVLNNFVSMPTPLKERGKLIAFAGRLSHEKAPDRFIEMARHFPKHTFILYGDGAMMAQLQFDLPSNVCFAGYQEMSEVWSNIDILVIPSRFEGLPMVALEAMARMIPVIAMNVGAMSNLISSRHNGWLCETEEQLNGALQSWITMNNNDRSNLQRRCRETIEANFSDHKVIPQILSYYHHSI